MYKRNAFGLWPVGAHGIFALAVFSALTGVLPTCHAATTIDAINHSAYGADIGWLNGRADTTNGAVIGEFFCTGYLYSANAGWISLGSGSPVNGIQYQNNSAGDFGVNNDGLGNLRGYAYGANIGWLNFEAIGAPKVDLRTGILSGSVWSANCGWISLSNAVAWVQTDSFWPGPLVNGLPTAWLLTYFGNVNVDPNANLNGLTVAQNYLAGTDPNDPSHLPKITLETVSAEGAQVSLTWLSEPTRMYFIQKSGDLAQWVDCGLGAISPSQNATTTVSLTDTSTAARYYRVKVVLPLSQ
ncbi:MAG TPA: hypothetical protein VF988_08825 [Verrucomicrobiae bacterium]